MDDLLEVTTFDRALMKIDIEGHEPYAFLNASRLFTKVHIPIILMEWGIRRSEKDTEKVKLVEKMIEFFTERHYRPVSDDTILDTSRWRMWPWDIKWKHRDVEF